MALEVAERVRATSLTRVATAVLVAAALLPIVLLRVTVALEVAERAIGVITGGRVSVASPGSCLDGACCKCGGGRNTP